ncbi:hypothetical protein JOF55_001285 [Haloactinomyces albus]|uniref:Uncharacterized protein n=1 Tax=Haloactinomyces albus TaxID=1352928 RepID=A0AAE4CKU0_9ACTN|nr:hypothetical protein [Haloactinomyces albus]
MEINENAGVQRCLALLTEKPVLVHNTIQVGEEFC